MSVERDSLCFNNWPHTWHTDDQYIRCVVCWQTQTAATEDYTDHEVWGFPVDYIPQKTWRDLTGPYIHHSRIDAEHDPKDRP